MFAGLLSLRALIPIAVAAALFAAGWQANAWHHDAKELAATRGAQIALAAQQKRESTIAQQVEQRLTKQKTTERIIDRGVIREIQKPIYQRVCIEPDAVRLLNSAALGRAPNAANAAAPVPGHAPDADGRAGRDDGHNDD